MISFEFSPDQTAFQKTLTEFSRKVLLPGYRDRAASTEFPFDILRQLGELGVLGIGLPEKYGGTGAEDPVTLGLATETLAYGDVNVASAPVQIGLIGSQLMHGTEEVQQRYLPAMIEGRENVAIALTEPGSGSDAAALRTRAVRDGDTYVLNGQKQFISGAGKGDLYVVMVRTGQDGPAGISTLAAAPTRWGTQFYWCPRSWVSHRATRLTARRITRPTATLANGASVNPARIAGRKSAFVVGAAPPRVSGSAARTPGQPLGATVIPRGAGEPLDAA